MEEAVDRYQHAGMTVEITLDSIPEGCDPREHCNVGVMLCAHRRYRLGDEQVDGAFSTSLTCPSCDGTGESDQRGRLFRRRPDGWVCVGAGSIESMRLEMSRIMHRAAAAGRPEQQESLTLEISDCPRCEGSGEIEVSLTEYLRRERGATVVLPLGLIDHSGISMYVGSGAHLHDPGGWDSGQVGVIFDTPGGRTDCGLENATPEVIERALRAEVHSYDQFLRGEVYCFTVIDSDGEHVDSCCGFLGDIDYVRSQANEAAEYAAASARHERDERQAMACRDIATV